MRSNTKFGTARNNPFAEFEASCLLLWLLFICLICYLGYELILATVNIGFNSNDPIGEYIIYCLYSIGISLYALQRMRYLQISWRRILGKFPRSYHWISLFGLVLIKLIFSIGIGLLWFSFLSLVAPTYVESLLEDADKANTQLSLVPLLYNLLEFIAYTIVAPVAEEFIFRGVLLHIWATKWKIGSAIILPSSLFGLLHFNPIGATIAGIIYALLYIKTGSLFVPVIAHAMNNSFIFIIPFVISLIDDNLNTVVPTLDTVRELWKLGLLFTAVSAPLIISFIYRKWSAENITLPYFANAIEVTKKRSL